MKNKKEFRLRPKFNRTYSKVIMLVAALATLITALVAVPLVEGGGNNSNVGANVIVPNTCSATLSNSLVTFSVSPGGNTGSTSANVITVTNTGGNPTNILISGGNPTYLSNSFYIENTIYSYGANAMFNPGSTPGGANEVRITGSPVDTQINIQGGGSTTNSVYLGQAVPALTPGGTYSFQIVIGTLC